ncbi:MULTISPECIES: formylglycine-generating enzyme family protein [unclassified Bradyrhizobium]|uniref:formylglycine-generating enzyme family protein n=1 Tax=unclassified Bradyrhizobium TaxID=2631580 RepID=UPI0035147BB0
MADFLPADVTRAPAALRRLRRPAAAPVRTFAPNEYGLHNVAGNVWEWCEDYISPGYHRLTPSRDTLNCEPAPNRSMRGGPFLCHGFCCNRLRVAAQSSSLPDSASSNGFRVVPTDPPRDPS